MHPHRPAPSPPIPRVALFVALGMAVALAASGCGGTSQAEVRAEQHKRELQEQHQHETEAHQHELQLRAEGEKCSGQLGALLTDEEELSGILSSGLNYEEYGQRVSKINVASEESPSRASLAPNCEPVDLNLTAAMNEWTKAHSEWTKCNEATGEGGSCTKAEKNAKLQPLWKKAEEELSEGKNSLEALKRGEDPF